MLILPMLFGAFQPPKPALAEPATVFPSGPRTRIASILLSLAAESSDFYCLPDKLAVLDRPSSDEKSRRDD
jgi:hypothetical protein